MLFVIYLILLLGGIYLVGAAFAAPVAPALVFVAGVLCVAAAVAVPVTASAMENRSDRRR